MPLYLLYQWNKTKVHFTTQYQSSAFFCNSVVVTSRWNSTPLQHREEQLEYLPFSGWDTHQANPLRMPLLLICAQLADRFTQNNLRLSFYSIVWIQVLYLLSNVLCSPGDLLDLQGQFGQVIYCFKDSFRFFKTLSTKSPLPKILSSDENLPFWI